MSTVHQNVLTIDDIRASTAATISRTEAAAALGVDPRTVSAGIAAGNIPAIQLGRRVLIPRAKFIALFEVEAATATKNN